MARVEVEGMGDYEPTAIKGTCTVEVKKAKLSETGKGFTLFLEIVEGPEDQDWMDEQIMHYVHTDMNGTNKSGEPYAGYLVKMWKKNLYHTCKAFKVKVNDMDTDDFVGKEAFAEVGPDKDGETEVKKWIYG